MCKYCHIIKMHSAKVINFILLSLCFIDYAFSVKLPSTVTPCKRNSVNLNNCILTAAKKFQREFVEGSTALGVPSLDPLKIEVFKLDTGNNGFKIDLKDITLSGFKEAKLQSIKFDPIKKKFSLDMLLTATTDTNYMATGMLMQFPFNGKGRFKMELHGLHLKINTNWNLVKGNDSKDHIKITTTKAQYTTESGNFQISGFLSKEMDNAMTSILNTNWRIIEPEVAPAIIAFLEGKIAEILNGFFDKVPYDELFPM